MEMFLKHVNEKLATTLKISLMVITKKSLVLTLGAADIQMIELKTGVNIIIENGGRFG